MKIDPHDLARHITQAERPRTYAEIAHKYDVSIYTAKRAVRRVREELGVTVDEHVRPGTREKAFWIQRMRRNRTYLDADEIITAVEVGTLRGAIDILKSLNMIHKVFILDDLDRKLRSRLSEEERRESDAFGERIREAAGFTQFPRIGVHEQPGFPRIFMAIQQGFLRRRKVQIFYRTGNRLVERIIWPLGFLNTRHKPLSYVIAIADEQGPDAYRNFRLHRIEKARLLEDRFTRPDDFDPEEYAKTHFSGYGGPILDVEVRFDDVQDNEEFKADNFGYQETREELLDGGVIVKFKARGEEAICHRLFEWRDTARIIRPHHLRRRYTKMLQDILACYID